MSLRRKLVVISAFAARLGVFAPLYARLVFIHQSLTSVDEDPTGGITAAAAAACLQLEIGYGILASVVPCLKPFTPAYEGPPRLVEKMKYDYGHRKDSNSGSEGKAQDESSQVPDYGVGPEMEDVTSQTTSNHARRGPVEMVEKGKGSIDDVEKGASVIISATSAPAFVK